jgi:hypothetical protein
MHVFEANDPRLVWANIGDAQHVRAAIGRSAPLKPHQGL